MTSVSLAAKTWLETIINMTRKTGRIRIMFFSVE
jgi:hypothetical protein